MVAIGKDSAAGTHRERKSEAALAAVTPRMHTRLHHALAHREVVAEFGKVSDGEKFHLASQNFDIRQKALPGRNSGYRNRKSDRGSGDTDAECWRDTPLH